MKAAETEGNEMKIVEMAEAVSSVLFRHQITDAPAS